MSESTNKPTISEQRQTNIQTISQLRDESESWWAWATSAWLLSIGLTLLLFPKFLLFLSQTSTSTNERATLTTLESFLCTHAGIWLSALSIALITSIPSPPPISRTITPDPPQKHPLLIPLSISLSITSFVAYNTSRIGALGVLMAIGCGVTGIWGLWVIAFEGTGNYSNKTGADKHTSSFLFGNKASASAQKKLWKKERDAEREIELQQMASKAD